MVALGATTGGKMRDLIASIIATIITTVIFFVIGWNFGSIREVAEFDIVVPHHEKIPTPHNKIPRHLKAPKQMKIRRF